MITVLRRSSGKVISLFFLTTGIFILMQVILPIASFQVWAVRQQINKQVLVSPIGANESVLGISIESKNNFPAFISSVRRDNQPNYNRFTLSVPRLKMEKTEVFVDTNDLSQGLAHLPGSALPGEKGNIFISGHSALSQFFESKSVPFAKLPDLKKGDQITVETPFARYDYEVIGFKIVDPADLSVLTAPEEQGRYISLMTCVPPGLNFKRLIVLGKMI